MKYGLLVVATTTMLLGCGKKVDPSAPSLLGHWQSDYTRLVDYDAQGKLLSDQTKPQHAEVKVTATTMSFAYTTPSGITRDEFTYRLKGEKIVVSAGGSNREGEEWPRLKVWCKS